jgi:ribonuclease T2
MRSRVRHAVFPFIAVLIALFGGKAFAEDSYLLALSWQPAFCAAHAAAAECKSAAMQAPHLVLHGLWPDWDVNGDGKRNAADDFCLSGESNRKAMLDLDAQATGNWLALPAVQLSTASSGDLAEAMPGTAAGLERHEWWKHGTCSDLAAEDYFATAIALLREVERGSLAKLIVRQAGATVQRKDLLAAFETDFGAKTARALVLDCDRSGAALNEIRIRLKRETIAQGLTAQNLVLPAKPPRGDCATEIRIPDGQN